MNKHATYQQLRGHLAYLKLAAAAEQLPAALEAAELDKPGYTLRFIEEKANTVPARPARRPRSPPPSNAALEGRWQTTMRFWNGPQL